MTACYAEAAAIPLRQMLLAVNFPSIPFREEKNNDNNLLFRDILRN